VSAAVAGSGSITTSLTTGAELLMVSAALTVVPVALPSDGVTWQTTTSPPAKAPARVAPTPAGEPPTSHDTVLASASPSASEKV